MIDDLPLIALRARYVFPVNGPPIVGGAVTEWRIDLLYASALIVAIGALAAWSQLTHAVAGTEIDRLSGASRNVRASRDVTIAFAVADIASSRLLFASSSMPPLV